MEYLNFDLAQIFDVPMICTLIKYINKKLKEMTNISDSIRHDIKKIKHVINKYQEYKEKCGHKSAIKYLLKFTKRIYKLYSKLYNNYIAILLTTGLDDVTIPENLAYFGFKFPMFTDVTLSKIEKLYDKGFRVFIGPNSSSALTALLPFFKSHPDAVGISLYSTTPVLSDRKIRNIYRLTPPDNLTTDVFVQFVKFKKYKHVHLLLQEDNELSNAVALTLYDAFLPLVGTLIDSVDIIPVTLSNINKIIKKIDMKKHISVVTLADTELSDSFRNAVINSKKLGNYIDNFGPVPTLIDPRLKDIYFFFSFEPPYERNIKKQIETLGLENTVTPLYDAVNIALAFSEKYDLLTKENSHKSNNKYIKDIIGAYGYLYFTENGDRSFIYYTVRVFKGDYWKPIFASQDHPSLGFSVVIPATLP